MIKLCYILYALAERFNLMAMPLCACNDAREKKELLPFATYLRPWPMSLSTSLAFLWLVTPEVWISSIRFAYPSSFFCKLLMLCVDFWFFFSNTVLILASCCLSSLAPAARRRYSLTFSVKIKFRMPQN